MIVPTGGIKAESNKDLFWPEEIVNVSQNYDEDFRTALCTIEDDCYVLIRACLHNWKFKNKLILLKK